MDYQSAIEQTNNDAACQKPNTSIHQGLIAMCVIFLSLLITGTSSAKNSNKQLISSSLARLFICLQAKISKVDTRLSRFLSERFPKLSRTAPKAFPNSARTNADAFPNNFNGRLHCSYGFFECGVPGFAILADKWSF